MDKDYMILEFVNKAKLAVMNIFGGPVNVDGVIRDVLTIEIDPKNTSIDDLKNIFEDQDNIAHLYTYESDYDENGNIIDTKIEIGEGYTILLGVEEVERKVNSIPGKIVPTQFETIYTVTLAQMTYDEWINSKYS